MEMQIADIPRLYTGIAEWLFCMTYIVMIAPPKWNLKRILVAVLSLLLQCAFLIFTDDVVIWLWVPCMIAAFILMGLHIHLQLGPNLKKTFFYTAKSFIYAEFAASLVWQMETYFLKEGAGSRPVWSALFVTLTYGLTVLLVWTLERETIKLDFREPLSNWETFTVPGIIILVFVFSNLNHLSGESPFSTGTVFDNFIFRTVVDGFGIALVYAYESHLRQLKMVYYHEQMQNMLRYQYESYRNYQDSMEYVHVLRHDLKHQIIGLQGEKDEKKRTEWINTMMEELKSLDTVAPSGNSVLDSIIGAKIPLIRKNSITFTCVADGKLIDFMHVIDICTLFGNALDNAIESSVLVEDPKRRLIHVSLSAQKKFVYIRCSNYYEQEVVMDENDSFMTTKSDKENHGYGISAMRYATEKYGGSLSVKAENNWFELSILLPIPE